MKARDILLYTTQTEKVNISVYFQQGSFWLNQKAMAELFGVNVPAISKHLRNIFDTKELDENAVLSILETTAQDGKNYNSEYFKINPMKATLTKKSKS
jgi:hypothetical protein